jgi:hypothetical protein
MDVVPPIHPLSHEALLQMDDEQLNELESQFNLPVGHFAGENVAIRRQAVLRYLTEG